MARRKLLKQHVEHYHKWLHNFIHEQTNSSQMAPDLSRLQRASKGSSIKSLLSKKGLLGFYSHLFAVPKHYWKWGPVIDLNRLNTFLKVEKFKMPESVRACLTRGGMGLLNRPFRCLTSHSHLPMLKKVPSGWQWPQVKRSSQRSETYVPF